MPLQLRRVSDDRVIWKNPVPGGADLCRPVRVSFEKESKDAVQTEMKRMKELADKIEPVHFEGICVMQNLIASMNDGKVQIYTLGKILM